MPLDPTQTAPAPAAERSQALTRRVLLVDDNEAWIFLVRTWLASAGYKLRSVPDGESALRDAAADPPDCVLLDFNLPDLTGIEVCRRLRGSRAACAVPIVMLSGPSREKAAALEAGADYFISKSENPAELLAVLKAVFRRRELDRGIVALGDLALDPRRREVFLGDALVGTLTPKMFELFYSLVLRSPEPVSREELFRQICESEGEGLSRALDLLLNRLRKCLPEELGRRIRSVQGFGYLYLPRR